MPDVDCIDALLHTEAAPCAGPAAGSLYRDSFGGRIPMGGKAPHPHARDGGNPAKDHSRGALRRRCGARGEPAKVVRVVPWGDWTMGPRSCGGC
jgi:hypothetical protein